MRHATRHSGLLIAGVAIGCGGGSPDLPEGWAAAKSMTLTQSECNNAILPMSPAETIEVRTWGPPVDVAYHDAHFRCAQKLCAYGRSDGDATAVLVQPCDMDPSSVAKCDCRYEVGLSVAGTPSAIEIHRRWDNLNQPNPPMLIGRVVRNDGKVCTEIGCGSAFEVSFAPLAGWPSGTYRIEVTADGATGACDVTIPLSCQGSSTCSGRREWVAIESGCALPAAQHAIAGIQFGTATPAQIEVTVSRSGNRLAAGTFSPTYLTSTPNGPGCEPTCRTALSASLTLAF